MKRVLLCQHGGSGNHGCEALVRTTYELIKTACPDSFVTLYSYKTADDKKYLSDLPLRLEGFESLPGKYSLYNIAYNVKRRLGMEASKLPLRFDFKQLVSESDLVIAIGGDNYCYNMGRGYYPTDAFVRANAKKTVLFGCSLEPDDLPRGLGEHLKKTFDAVTVRESISFDAVKTFGVDSAVLVHDPAFLLPVKKAPEKQNAVGINLSPLALGLGNNDMIMSNYLTLVRYLLDNTDMKIYLVPHVVWKDNDDRIPLTLLKKAFDSEERVILSDDAPASELKGLISSLRFFVGARTHATIAAYSTCVPTLVAGYSVKARGIARDLMGTEDGFVVPVQQMREKDELTSAFKKIMNDEKDIQNKLKSIMPSYTDNAKSASMLIKDLLS